MSVMSITIGLYGHLVSIMPILSNGIPSQNIDSTIAIKSIWIVHPKVWNSE